MGLNKQFLATTFTLTGTIIGAGILGLPYVFARSTFLIGTFWLILLTIIITLINLSLANILLKTKEYHQLPGYAEKYLGKIGKNLMLSAVIFGIYSALLAYLIGLGESFAKTIPLQAPPFIFAIAFWLIAILILKQGLSGLKKIETWGVTLIIATTLTIFIKFLPQISTTNLTTISTNNFFSPIGVILFALLGFVAIPELKKEIKGSEHLLKKAIIIGTIIPSIIYLIFAATFVGVLGKNITQVATLSFGPLITLLGIFTMLTSYFALSFSLKDTLKLDLKISKRKNFLLTSIAPMIIYLITIKLGLTSFTSILGIAGSISAGTTGILIIAMSYKSKTKHKKSKK